MMIYVYIVDESFAFKQSSKATDELYSLACGPDNRVHTYMGCIVNGVRFHTKCGALKPGGPLTTRQPAEYKWMSGYPTPLQKIGQSLVCTGSSTQMNHLHETCPKQSNIVTMIQIWIKTASWAHTTISIETYQL